MEALTDLRLARSAASDEEVGMDAVNEWTLQLLRIRHYGQAEKRLHALFALVGESALQMLQRLLPARPFASPMTVLESSSVQPG